MAKIQLIHPKGKKAIAMDISKYEVLKDSFLTFLKKRKTAHFKLLLANVEDDLKQRNVKFEGNLEWHLFWVTLDLESRKELSKDKSTSPILYSSP